MNVFLTGGAGYVGRAVTRDLAHAGHRVTALVRGETQEQLVRSLGAEALQGDLRDPATYVAAAAGADAVVHLAVLRETDWTRANRAVVDALLDTAHPRARHFLYVSVLFVLGDTPEGADETAEPAGGHYTERAALERHVLAAAGEGLTCSVVRPAMVYGGGDGGTISHMFRTALDGAPQFIGSGANRWPLVHREDVASLIRLVVEKNATGIFHACDGAALPVREIADLVGAAAGSSATPTSIPLDEARGQLGAFADALCLDQPVEATRSRALGWLPLHPPFPQSVHTVFAEFVEETASTS